MFIKPQHPKHNVPPLAADIKRVLEMGWVCQAKMDGRRAQIHLGEEVIAFTRQGDVHTKPLTKEIEQMLRQLFPQGSVIDAEWFPTKKRLFIFDVLRWGDESLRFESFSERHARLPKIISPHISILPVIKTLKRAMEVIASQDKDIEGLVFRSPDTKGWPDSAIIRCRKEKK